ncbi:MAG: hypothetical protein KH334_01625 [Clostridiales bacterium]|nr:hypothetical protein [Clostridiales bacterium]
MELTFNQKFRNRQEISNILGGDTQKGIALSRKKHVILLFTNEQELYTDYFYPKGSYDYCMYTGIGRYGDQDNVENNMYNLNVAVLAHKVGGRKLLIFEKREPDFYFVGEYQLMKTHQNVQPDENNKMRRVFVFHLKQVAEKFTVPE